MQSISRSEPTHAARMTGVDPALFARHDGVCSHLSLTPPREEGAPFTIQENNRTSCQQLGGASFQREQFGIAQFSE